MLHSNWTKGFLRIKFISIFSLIRKELAISWYFLSFTFSPFFYRKSGVFPLWEVRLIVLKNFALKGQSWSNGNFFSFTFLCNTLIFLSGHINIWLNFSIYIIFQNHLLKWCELSEGFIRFPLLKRHIED